MEAAAHNPALAIALALAAGMVCHVVARHLQVPSIVVLLLAGVLLGPEVAGVIHPESLGGALQDLVGMAVAVILFEGGLNLSLHRLRGEASTLRRLVTVGALVSAVGGTLAAYLIMGWRWELAVPFGALLVVTGPTVIQPLLRRITVKHNVSTILEGEAVFIDAIGAILAVVAFEVVLATEGAAATGLLGLPGRFAVGVGLGAAGGILVGLLLRSPRLVPEGLKNVLALAFVLALYEVSEAAIAESGIMTAAVAGLVVGNMETGVGEELKEFKEQLTVLLLGLLFVLLAATVEIREVVGLGWRGAATVLALMVVVRPLCVAVSTAGSDLTLQERTFLAWLAPRGIVAAAVASLFAQWMTEQGIAGGTELQALVFLVIAVTVVVLGGFGGLVASLLDLRYEEREGHVVVGANPIGRTLAHALEQAGESVVVVDSSERACREARREGLETVDGSATEERVLVRTELQGRRGLVAVTANPEVNLQAITLARGRFGVEELSVALGRRHGGAEEARIHESGAGLLFGVPVNVGFWSHEFRKGTVDISCWRFTEEQKQLAPGPGGEGWRDRGGVDLLPLVLVRGSRAEPVTDRLEFERGDEVYFAWPYAAGTQAGQWLAAQGWEPVAELPEPQVPAEAEGSRTPEDRERPEGGNG